MFDTYLVNNVVFITNIFFQHVHEYNRIIGYCGVSINNQHGSVERSICMVSEMDFHQIASLINYLKNIIGSNLWQMDTSYANHIYNQMTNADYIDPADIFTGPIFPFHNPKGMHVFVCLV